MANQVDQAKKRDDKKTSNKNGSTALPTAIAESQSSDTGSPMEPVPASLPVTAPVTASAAPATASTAPDPTPAAPATAPVAPTAPVESVSPAPPTAHVAAATPVNPEPVPPPMPTLDDLPAEVQDILKQFKNQIGSAPEPFQRLIMTYLAPSEPKPEATPAPTVEVTQSQQVPAQQVQVQVQQVSAQVGAHGQVPTESTRVFAPPTQPVQPRPAQPAAQTAVAASYTQGLPAQSSAEPSPILRVFPKADVPDGFQAMPSILLYSWSANGFRPLRSLIVDVMQWGSKMVFVAMSNAPIKALSADGTVEDLPPKTPFAIPVDTDISNLVRPIVEDPAGAYETLIVPRSEDRGSDGIPMLRFRAFLGVRLLKSTVWPPK